MARQDASRGRDLAAERARRCGYKRAIGKGWAEIASGERIAQHTAENYPSHPTLAAAYWEGWRVGIEHSRNDLLPTAISTQSDLLTDIESPPAVRASVAQAVISEHGRDLDRVVKRREIADQIAADLLLPMMDGVVQDVLEFVPEERRGECELRLRARLAGGRPT